MGGREKQQGEDVSEETLVRGEDKCRSQMQRQKRRARIPTSPGPTLPTLHWRLIAAGLWSTRLPLALGIMPNSKGRGLVIL